MSKIAASRTTTTPQGEQSLVSFYNSRRLKLYTPAEIEHCENSKTQNISMQRQFKPRIQENRTKQGYSLLLSLFIDVIIRHLLTTFWSTLKLESMIHTIF
jgi:hypothetical protein